MEVSRGLPWWSDGNESACDAGDPALIPGSERAPGEGNGKTRSSILAGESHRQRSLAGCSPRGRKESDTTERAHTTGVARGDVREPRSARTCCVPKSSVLDLSGSQFLKCKPASQISKLSSGALGV